MSTNDNIQVKNLKIRNELYEQVCKPGWENISGIINKLIAIGNEEAIGSIKEFISRKELEPYYLFYNELIALQIAIEIYELEKATDSRIFLGTSNMAELIEKINYMRFQLIRIDNDIPADDYFCQAVINSAISTAAINVLIERNCFDKVKVRDEIDRLMGE